MAIECSTERKANTLVIYPSGRLDALGSDTLLTEVHNVVLNTDQHLIIDLSGLVYLSSAGLRALATIARDVRKQDIDIHVCSPISSVGFVFKISGFDQLIPLHSDQMEAETAIAKQ